MNKETLEFLHDEIECLYFNREEESIMVLGEENRVVIKFIKNQDHYSVILKLRESNIRLETGYYSIEKNKVLDISELGMQYETNINNFNVRIFNRTHEFDPEMQYAKIRVLDAKNNPSDALIFHVEKTPLGTILIVNYKNEVMDRVVKKENGEILRLINTKPVLDDNSINNFIKAYNLAIEKMLLDFKHLNIEISREKGESLVK